MSWLSTRSSVSIGPHAEVRAQPTLDVRGTVVRPSRPGFVRHLRVRRGAGLASVCLVTLALAGCFRPLHGPTASGVPLSEALASIELDRVGTPEGQERIGHYLRSELAFGLNGSGTPQPKRYRLKLDAAESIQPISVDTTSGRADAALLNATVRYALETQDGRKVLTGTARGNATYERDQQRFASVRAARDTDIRVAKAIAEDIKARLAAYFATNPAL